MPENVVLVNPQKNVAVFSNAGLCAPNLFAWPSPGDFRLWPAGTRSLFRAETELGLKFQSMHVEMVHTLDKSGSFK